MRRTLSMVVLAVMAIGAAPPAHPVDRFGDPMPYGAVARLGTRRIPFAASPLVFLPGGKYALWHTQLIDARTGERLRSFELGHDPSDNELVGACSADGKLVALWARGGALRVWKAETGEKVFDAHQRDFPDTAFAPRAMAFSPDSKTFFTGGSGTEFTRWDLCAGKPVPFPKGIPAEPRSVRVAPDGRRAALVDNGELGIWDLTTGQLTRRVCSAKSGNRLAWSPNGKLLAVTSTVERAGVVTVYNLEANTSRAFPLEVPLAHAGPIFSPDSKKVATSGMLASAFVWEVETGKRLGHIHCENNGCPLVSIAFTSDARLLASTSRRGIVEVETGRDFLANLPGHRSGVISPVVLADNKTALTASWDGTVRMWELTTGKELAVLARGVGEARILAASPDGKHFAVGTPSHLYAWRLRGLVAEMYLKKEELTNHAAFSPSGDRLIAGKRWMRVWDTNTGKQLQSSEPHDSHGFTSLAISHDERMIATGGYEGAIRLWDAANSKPIGTLPGHGLRQWVTALAFLPDGRSLISGGQDGTARLWEIATASERKRYTNRIPVSTINLSHDGRLCFLPGPPVTYSFTDLTNTDSAPIGTMRDSTIYSVLTPNGRYLLNSTQHGVITWDVRHFVTAPRAGRKLPVADLQKRWPLLADADAGKAFAAICDLADNGVDAVAVLRDQLRPDSRVRDKDLQQYLTDLDAEEFEKRQKAFTTLAALGERAREAIEAAARNPPSLEVRRQLKRLLELLVKRQLSAEVLQAIRAVETLERIGSPAALDVLKKLASGEPQAHLTRHAAASVKRLEKR